MKTKNIVMDAETVTLTHTDYFHIYLVRENHKSESIFKLGRFSVGFNTPDEKFLSGMTFHAKWVFPDLDSAQAFAKEQNDRLNQKLRA